MTDCSVTWADERVAVKPEFWIYVKSIGEHFKGERLLFTDGLSDQSRGRIKQAGFEVIDCQPGLNVMHRRFLEFHRTLKARRGAYRYVMHTDARDVLFQANPILAITDMHAYAGTNELVILASEGVVHKNHQWNWQDQSRHQGMYPPWARMPFDDFPVLNGGSQFGTHGLITDYFLQLALLGMNYPQYGGDQAINAFLYLHRQPDKRYVIAHPHKDRLIATGDSIHWGNVQVSYPEPHKVCMADGVTPYSIVHQWDRTPAKDAILAKYPTINIGRGDAEVSNWMGYQ